MKLAERERSALSKLLLPSPVHIRHQRQHLAQKDQLMESRYDSDPRSKIIDSKIVVRNEEFNQRYNSTDINR